MYTNEKLKNIDEIIRKIDFLVKNVNTEFNEITDISPQDVFIQSEINAILEHLSDASDEYHAFLSDETTIYIEDTLAYNKQSKRFSVGTVELHCGDPIEVCVQYGDSDGLLRWIPTNIEYADSWYLIGVGRGFGITCEKDLIGLPARLRRRV